MRRDPARQWRSEYLAVVLLHLDRPFSAGDAAPRRP